MVINKCILIIDDEEKIRGLLSRILELEGYNVQVADTAKNGLSLLDRRDCHVIICDVSLPDANGVELIKSIKEKYPLAEIILFTGYGTISDGVKAIKNGAFDYITKSTENDKIIPTVARAFEKIQLRQRVIDLQNKVELKFGFTAILGSSKSIQECISLARKVSATDTTTLLLGETGTGKEVFARAIHNEGRRKNKNFVALNCSAFSRELLESELFGYKAGAFTGATRDKKGLLEEANEGTLFLDEIGEMNLDLQAKLLRVLETGEFYKVGDSKASKVDLRVIAASNRDLKNEAETGLFRLDLFYRLSVFQIKLPALRDRIEDIDMLIDYFISIYAKKVNKQIPAASNEFKAILRQQTWNGNIRELKNVLERAVILAEGDKITRDQIPYEFQFNLKSDPVSSGLTLDDLFKEHIIRVLKIAKNNKTETARILGIGLTTLYRKLEEYKLDESLKN
jgi:two-component system NtrC family response regulator